MGGIINSATDGGISTGHTHVDGQAVPNLAFFHYPEEAVHKHSIEVISVNELRGRFKELQIDDDEEILWMEIYTENLWDSIARFGLLYHAFILIETDSWYYTVEKTHKHVTLQRSAKKAILLDLYETEDRKRTTFHKADASGFSMKDLIQLLGSEMLRSYHVIDDNCRAFVTRVFETLAISQPADISVYGV